MINPFKKNDPEYREFKRAEEEVRNNLQSLSIVTKDILADERYKKFSDLIKRAEENTIDLFLRYKEDDPYKYKAKADELLVELRVYRNLMSSIKDLSNPKPKPNPKFVQNFKGEIQEILERI